MQRQIRDGAGRPSPPGLAFDLVKIRAADVTDYRIVEECRASRSPGPSKAELERSDLGDEGAKCDLDPVDEELQRWIECRLVRASKEERVQRMFRHADSRSKERYASSATWRW